MGVSICLGPPKKWSSASLLGNPQKRGYPKQRTPANSHGSAQSQQPFQEKSSLAGICQNFPCFRWGGYPQKKTVWTRIRQNFPCFRWEATPKKPPPPPPPRLWTPRWIRVSFFPADPEPFPEPRPGKPYLAGPRNSVTGISYSISTLAMVARSFVFLRTPRKNEQNQKT